MINIDGTLYSESVIRSIMQTGAGYVITLADGEVISTFYEPITTTFVAANGIELWQPVDVGPGQVEWGIAPICAFSIERGVVSGTATMTDIVPVSGDTADCTRGVLVDRQRRLAWVLDSTSGWSSDLAAVLSEALGRAVEVDDNAFTPRKVA